MDRPTSLIFVDAKPSEQLVFEENKFLCFSAVTPSITDGLKKLKGYKSTPKSRKAQEAKRIVGAIEDKTLRFTAISFAGFVNGHLVQWAQDSMNNTRKRLGGTWLEDEESGKIEFAWRDSRFNVSLAMGIAAYSSILGFVGLWFGKKAVSDGNIEHLVLCLDKLPGVPEDGMELMRELTFNDPSIIKMWRENIGLGVTYQVGNLGSYKSPKGKNRPGKLHPFAILADWYAAASVAYLNPTQIENESNLSTSEIDALASIYVASEQSNCGTLISLDDDEILKSVKEAIQ